MKRKKHQGLKITGIILVALVVAGLFYIKVNFTGLNGWARDLEKIPPPSSTIVLKYNKVKGNLGLANRAYKDYGAYWIVSSDLSAEELFEHYTTDMPEARSDVIPVSYTHLDVYKRQRMNNKSLSSQ